MANSSLRWFSEIWMLMRARAVLLKESPYDTVTEFVTCCKLKRHFTAGEIDSSKKSQSKINYDENYYLFHLNH